MTFIKLSGTLYFSRICQSISRCTLSSALTRSIKSAYASWPHSKQPFVTQRHQDIHGLNPGVTCLGNGNTLERTFVTVLWIKKNIARCKLKTPRNIGKTLENVETEHAQEPLDWETAQSNQRNEWVLMEIMACHWYHQSERAWCPLQTFYLHFEHGRRTCFHEPRILVQFPCFQHLKSEGCQFLFA